MERRTGRALRGLVGVLFVLMLEGCVSAYAGALARGDELSQQGRWAEAEAHYRRALAERPHDEAARTRLRVALWNRSKELAEQSERALAAGDALGGLRLARAAIEIDAAVPEAQRAHERASALALDEVERLARAGQTREALARAAAVRAEIPRNERAARLEADLRERVASADYERADAFAARGMPGNALLSLIEAEKTKPGYRDAQARARALRERLSRELSFHLVVAEAEGASTLSRELAGELRRLGPSPSRPLLLAAAQAPADAQGARVEPTLSEVRRERQTQAEPRSCAYVCGVDRSPNPAREALARRVDEEERRLHLADDEAARLKTALRQAQQHEDSAAAALKVALTQLERAQGELSTCQRNAGKNKDDKGKDDKGDKGKDDKGKGDKGHKAPCGREQERVREAQREVDERKAALPVAQAARARAEADEAQRLSEAKTARGRWESVVAELARTPAVLETPRSCQHHFHAEIHTVRARTVHDLRARPLGRARVNHAASEVLVSSSDETFPPQGRCNRASAGDPLTLPGDETLDRLLLQKASTEAAAAVASWYDAYAADFLAEAERAGRAGRVEEATEARVRHRLLTGRPIDG